MLQSSALTAEIEAGITGLVAAEFGKQNALRTPNDWSRSAIGGFKTQVDDTIRYLSLLAAVAVSVTTLVNGILKTGIGAVLAKSQPTLLRLIYGGTATLEGIGSSTALQGSADSYINSMNHDLGYA